MQGVAKALREIRDRAQQAERRSAAREQRLTGLKSAQAELNQPITEAENNILGITAEEQSLSGLEELRQNVQELRALLAEKRARVIESKSAHEILRKEMQARQDRLVAIDRDYRSWGERAERAEQQLASLAQASEYAV